MINDFSALACFNAEFFSQFCKSISFTKSLNFSNGRTICFFPLIFLKLKIWVPNLTWFSEQVLFSLSDFFDFSCGFPLSKIDFFPSAKIFFLKPESWLSKLGEIFLKFSFVKGETDIAKVLLVLTISPATIYNGETLNIQEPGWIWILSAVKVL